MPPGNASSRTSSFGGLPPTASRTPAACSSRRRGTTPPTATRSSRAAGQPGSRSRRSRSSEALRREPRLHPDISRAFTVPDAALDPWKLVWTCARSAQEHGAQILLYHRVLGLERDSQRVSGALVRNELTGEELRIQADVVVNAAGAWAGEIAELAGCRVDRRARQGDHDRDEPSARADGGQPLQAVGGRRHSRPDPHGLRDRDDRHAGRRPGRARGDAARGRRDARRG